MFGLIDFAKETIANHGYTGVFLLTTVEQFIFPVPADLFITMSTSAGLTLRKIMPIITVATLFGALAGYFLGKFLGHPVFVWLFGKEKLDKGEAFVKKWGFFGVFIAGLTPLPFKIVTWTAGILEMPLWKFIPAVLIGRLPRYFLVALAGIFVIKTKFYATTSMSAIILGCFQGITEFLPISSSGHLVIMEQFLNLPLGPEEMAMFDIILHGGSLLAILIFFWRDWIKVFKDIYKMIRRWTINKDSLAVKLILGTIPAIITGLIFGDQVTGKFRNIYYIAMFFIIMAMIYFYVVWKRGRNNDREHVTLKDAILMGLAQAVALMPGVSRSGATLSTGILSGLKGQAAAKFSFMLGAVAIFAANVYALVSIGHGTITPDLKFTLIGFSVSFVFSLLAIAFLLKYLVKHTMAVFGIYLLTLGMLILNFM